MEHYVKEFLTDQSTIVVLLVLAICLGVLGKSADWLVEMATKLSAILKIPSVIVGATIVSLGTTTPEAAVSVMAALYGKPDLALGNAVGSIICDTGLILGLSAVIGVVPINKSVVNRQGYIQLAAAFLLVIASIPWSNLAGALSEGSSLPQYWGFVFLGLLVAYLVWSVSALGKKQPDKIESVPEAGEELVEEAAASPWMLVLGILIAVGIVVVSAQCLIAAAEVSAIRVGVPKAVIAATLVAFGTSLPELVVCVTSVLRKQGELALGNVIGADILNVLFVVGAAAAVTPTGLLAGPEFFRFQFPSMIIILIVLRIALIAGGKQLPRWGGAVLLGLYIASTAVTLISSKSMDESNGEHLITATTKSE